MNAKKMTLLLGLVIIIFAGCGKSQNQIKLSVEGEVTQEIYMSLGGGGIGSTASPIAYHVKVTIRNLSSMPITFNEIIADFFPEQGTHLKQMTYAYDEKMGDNQESYQVDARKPINLAVGESREWNFGTNGYTFNLLRDAGDKPLRFSITFNNNKQTIAGPFIATLPDLQTLSSYEKTILDKEAKGQQLTFSQ